MSHKCKIYKLQLKIVLLERRRINHRSVSIVLVWTVVPSQLCGSSSLCILISYINFLNNFLWISDYRPLIIKSLTCCITQMTLGVMQLLE